jgi:hypothetical protein
LRPLLRRKAFKVLSASKTAFALRLGHLVDTIKLLHQPLLLAFRQPIEAGVVAQHALLILCRNAAMRIEPGAEMAGRRI